MKTACIHLPVWIDDELEMYSELTGYAKDLILSLAIQKLHECAQKDNLKITDYIRICFGDDIKKA